MVHNWSYSHILLHVFVLVNTDKINPIRQLTLLNMYVRRTGPFFSREYRFTLAEDEPPGNCRLTGRCVSCTLPVNFYDLSRIMRNGLSSKHNFCAKLLGDRLQGSVTRWITVWESHSSWSIHSAKWQEDLEEMKNEVTLRGKDEAAFTRSTHGNGNILLEIWRELRKIQ